MSDPIGDRLPGIDGARPLSPEFRERLLASLIARPSVSAAAAGAEPSARTNVGASKPWSIDGPRALPSHLKARLITTLTYGTSRTPTWLVTSVAAACALLLIASGMVLMSGQQSPLQRKIQAFDVDDSLVPTHRQAPMVRPPGSLQGFASSAEFLSYVRGEALRLAGPYGVRQVSILGGGQPEVVRMRASAGQESAGSQPQPQAMSMPATGGPAFSGTNIQEEGVDEPDIVKTDGRRMVVMAQSKVWILDVTHGASRLTGSIDLPDGVGIFLLGDRLIHIANVYEQPPEPAPSATPLPPPSPSPEGSPSPTPSPDISASPTSSPSATPSPTAEPAPLPVSSMPRLRGRQFGGRTWTQVTVVDISRPSSPRTTGSMKAEGTYVGARLAGGVVRMVLQSGNLGPLPVPLTDYSEAGLTSAEAANRAAIRRSRSRDWLPSYVLDKPGRKPVTGRVLNWDKVSRPPDDAGVSMVTLMTIDPGDLRPDDAVSVMGAGEIIYSSLQNMYVTSGRLDDILAAERGRIPSKEVTRVHKFDISDPKIARYVGSGEIPGHLLNQFSMSEHEGRLRVASTFGFPWNTEATAESLVTVLEERGGALIPLGSVGGLGRGERVYSVRFIGPMGYVVTFRQVDPLYVIDLHDPIHPRVAGELKVPGYSGYLHPLSPTLLLGIGRDADEEGRTGGIRFSLFDVSAPANPRLLHERTVGVYGYSEVENDHHSFLYWEPRGFFALPANLSDRIDGGESFQGLLSVPVSARSGFGEPTRLTHFGRQRTEEFYPAIRRSLVVGDRFFTVSDMGVLMSDIRTFGDLTWVPLAA